MEEKKNNEKGVVNARAKMFTYVGSLIYNNDFIDTVVAIRKNFGLPAGGFIENISDELIFINSRVYVDERGEETDFQKAVYDLASTFGLTTAWLDAVISYVLYDDFFFKKIPSMIQVMELSQIIEEQEQYDHKPMLDENKKKIAIKILENISDSLPVGIFISPYATGRDIIDYVKKRYKKEIEPTQLKYRVKEVKIGGVRQRNSKTQRRDLFICEHRDLPKKKLVSLVNEEFGCNLDYTYINKIIAKKCKKRK